MKFKITYYLGTDVTADRVVEAETLEDVKTKYVGEVGILQFTNENNVFYKLRLQEVKMIKVKEVKGVKAVEKPSYI